MNSIKENEKSTRANVLYNLLNELDYANIKDFQKANGLQSDGIFGILSYECLYNKLLQVENTKQHFTNFIKESTQKTAIVLHHSAGADNANGMFENWQNDAWGAVATSVGIERSGKVVKGFDEQYWAWHTAGSQFDKHFVACEVMNWGWLTEKNGKLYNYVNGEIPKEQSEEVNFKGIKHYHKYTLSQINSLKWWVLLNAMRFDIPLKINHNDLWELCPAAQNNTKKGIFTHNSFRTDKTDVSPQIWLLEMLNSLELYELDNRL